MKTLKRIAANKYLLTFLGVALFFILWILIYFIAGANRTIFPDPSETISTMFEFLKDPYTYSCIAGSFERMLIGFSIASALGILLGVIVGNLTKLKYVFNPTMIALKAIPTAALVFLFLMLAGLKAAPIYIVMVIVFPIVYEATVAGYTSIDKDVLMSAQVDGATRVRSNVFIKFPLAMPTITLGLISSFALSFKIEIMAEVISGSSADGLGRAIQHSYEDGLVPTFAYSLIAIIVVLLVSVILYFLKKILKLKA